MVPRVTLASRAKSPGLSLSQGSLSILEIPLRSGWLLQDDRGIIATCQAQRQYGYGLSVTARNCSFHAEWIIGSTPRTMFDSYRWLYLFVCDFNVIYKIA